MEKQIKDKQIKNIGKVCTSSNCPSGNKFPYCAEGCLSVILTVEYKDDLDTDE
jgi:hypothetical protein